MRETLRGVLKQVEEPNSLDASMESAADETATVQDAGNEDEKTLDVKSLKVGCL